MPRIKFLPARLVPWVVILVGLSLNGTNAFASIILGQALTAARTFSASSTLLEEQLQSPFPDSSGRLEANVSGNGQRAETRLRWFEASSYYSLRVRSEGRIRSGVPENVYSRSEASYSFEATTPYYYEIEGSMRANNSTYANLQTYEGGTYLGGQYSTLVGGPPTATLPSVNVSEADFTNTNSRLTYTTLNGSRQGNTVLFPTQGLTTGFLPAGSYQFSVGTGFFSNEQINSAPLSLSYDARYSLKLYQPTDNDAAALAGAARAAYPSGGIVGYPLSYSDTIAIPGTNVRIERFENDEGRTVFAVRGTQLFDGDSSDFLADTSWIRGRPTSELSRIVERTADQLSAIINEVGRDNIILTGHSLGGAIAQALGVASGIETVTFNSPGMGGFLSDLSSELDSVRPPLFSPLPNIKNYRLFGDQVSLAGAQIGEVITVDSPVTNLAVSATPIIFALRNHSIDELESQLRRGADTQQGFGSGIQNAARSLYVARTLIPGANSFVYEYELDAQTNDWAFPDPPAAMGYEIAIGAGDPFITSAFFPDYGDEWAWLLELFDGSNWYEEAFLYLPGEKEFTFASPVERLRVFNYNAILDSVTIGPGNFVPGLRFEQDGTFTGTITSIGEASSVPTPATLALFTIGLAGLGWSRRKKA